MPTPAEKKALVFLACVGLLGASVRALRAVGAVERVPAQDTAALAQQLDAVDSARRVVRGKSSRSRGRHRLPPDTLPERGSGGAGRGARRGSDATTTPDSPLPTPALDVDVASAAQLEALPGIGPALAKRIVEDRDTRGSFGSLANLRRVKGIGPTLAKTLEPLVTFSGTPRPLSAITPDSSLGIRSDVRRHRFPPSRSAPRVPPPSSRAPPPATWLLQSSPSSASAISSSARG